MIVGSYAMLRPKKHPHNQTSNELEWKRRRRMDERQQPAMDTPR